MAKTLLQIITEFCDRTGLDRPSAIAGSTDAGVRQFKGLANEVITDITNRGKSWPFLQKQALFTSVADEDQGLMTTIAPYGFQYIIPETLYDRTARRPLWGPRQPGAWQESEALPFTGPMYTYRVWQGHFKVQPAMPAGSDIAFEYASNMAILGDASATDFKRWFDADTDTFLLDEELLLSGLRWKWKSEKGLTFITEKQDYENLIVQLMGNDSTAGEVNMAGALKGVRPGIYVPLGNWNV